MIRYNNQLRKLYRIEILDKVLCKFFYLSYRLIFNNRDIAVLNHIYR